MPRISWTPIRQGLIYCSPACGHGCKITEYDRAHLRANKLAAKMGRGWKTQVWENLGWHYAVYSPDKMWRISGENYWKPHYFISLGNEDTGQICTASADSLDAAISDINKKIKAKISSYEALLVVMKASNLKGDK